MPTIPIYNKCNNSCIMCTNRNDCRNMDSRCLSLPYLLRRIEKFSKGHKEFLDDYRDSFSITGGEPTLHPELVNIMKRINHLFPRIKINLLTNGRMFSYENYTKEIMRLDFNLELLVSIHGHRADIHDKITGVKNSFTQAIKGLENILRFKKPSHIVEIRIVIHQINYRFLQKITEFFRVNFPQVNRLVFIFFEIEGQAVKNFLILRLTYTQLLPYLDEVYREISYFSDVRFYHFPLCTLPLKFYPYMWRTLPSFEVSFLKGCSGCSVKKLCLGIHKGYLKYVGVSEFKPIENNFDIKNCNNWYHPIEKAIVK